MQQEEALGLLNNTAKIIPKTTTVGKVVKVEVGIPTEEKLVSILKYNSNKETTELVDVWESDIPKSGIEKKTSASELI